MAEAHLDIEIELKDWNSQWDDARCSLRVPVALANATGMVCKASKLVTFVIFLPFEITSRTCSELCLLHDLFGIGGPWTLDPSEHICIIFYPEIYFEIDDTILFNTIITFHVVEFAVWCFIGPHSVEYLSSEG